MSVLRQSMNSSLATCHPTVQAALDAAAAHIRSGDAGAAEASLRPAVELRPDDPAVRHLLGVITMLRGDARTAEAHLRAAVDGAPRDARYRGDLGVALRQLGRPAEALGCFKAAYELDPTSAIHARGAANLLQQAGNAPDALLWMERAARLGARELADHVHLAGLYRDLGKTTASIACLDRAIEMAPNDLGLRLYRMLARLPICYATDDELRVARKMYGWALDDLEWRTESAGPAALAMAAFYVGQISIFYLTYQGEDSTALQRRYGDLVARYVQARLPQFAERPTVPASGRGKRIRIGFVSAFFSPRHSNWKMPIRGWVENLDREQFEIFGYHVGPASALSEEVAQRFGDRFRRCSGLAVEEFAATIRRDELHVLVYPEVGMWPPISQCAALWLAPIQCASWGHPETSGLPTVQYFLSSALMEPADGDRYYTEQLVRLPNLSVNCHPPEIAVIERDRAYFGIAADAACYFCAQSLFKYLPNRDHLFAQIAKRVPKAQFAFIAGLASPDQSLRVKQRIERALAAAGVDPSGRVVMVSRPLSQEEFHALARVSDVFLDTLDWSGCNSVMEAMSTGLPVATLPGRFLRGRHTYAFLRMMGLPELIAASDDDYVDLMATLGTDAGFRGKVRESIVARIGRIYDDKECVAGLERFVRDAVAAPSNSPRSLEPRLLDSLRSEIRARLGSRIPRDRPLALVDFPDSKNCGDLAIWHGEASFLREIGVTPAFRCSMQDYRKDDLARALGERGVILLHGGGNFGDIYVYHQFREQVLRDFPLHDAILFPHTAMFHSEEALRQSADFYNARGRITLCARDQRSFELFRSRFDRCESLLVPDMAFMLDPQQRPCAPNDDILVLARLDGESALAGAQSVRGRFATTQEAVDLSVDGFPGSARLTTHRAKDLRITDWYELDLVEDVSRQAYAGLDYDARSQLQFAWAKTILALGRVVVTDRLHGHILCLLMGIPHVLFDNNYGKLGDFVRTWSGRSPLVRVASTLDDAVATARGIAVQLRAIDPPQSDLASVIRRVRAERLTYLTGDRLASIAEACGRVESAGVPGAFIETGCALGGSAIVIAKCKSPGRVLRIYDLFSTIPPPSARDGDDVHRRYREIVAGAAKGIGGDTYYGYEANLLQKVTGNLARYDVIPALDDVELVGGLFSETLRADQSVAFAHIDCDWYDSVVTCLERIVPNLAAGGIVLVDDYSDWSGCRKAVDDYFRGLQHQFKLELLPHGPLRILRPLELGGASSAWRTMPPQADSWGHRAKEVARLVPENSCVLDLGCGTMEVEKFLPESCRYIPCDCVARDARTLVRDLENDELPSIKGVTMVTVLGVFEYITRLEDLLRRLRGCGLPAIVSYVPYHPRHLSIEQRSELRWTTHLTQEQWCDALRAAGFNVELLKPLDQDPTQYLYRLT